MGRVLLGVGVALLACGCAEVANSKAGTAQVVSSGELRDRAVDHLVGDVERLYPERARVESYGRVRWTPTSELQGSTIEHPAFWKRMAPLELVVIDSTDDAIRVVASEGPYRLAFWIGRDDLHRVITETTQLAAMDREGGPQLASTGVEVYPGLAVGIDDRRGKRIKVSFADRSTEFSGWVDDAVVGELYVPVSYGQKRTRSDILLANGVPILEHPSGLPIAHTAGVTGSAQPAEWVKDEGEQHALVRLLRPGYRITGYVPRSALAEGRQVTLTGLTGTGMLRIRGAERRKVREGTCFFSEPGGAPVGRVMKTVYAAAERGENGWWRFRLATRWGVVNAWAEWRPTAMTPRFSSCGDIRR